MLLKLFINYIRISKKIVLLVVAPLNWEIKYLQHDYSMYAGNGVAGYLCCMVFPKPRGARVVQLRHLFLPGMCKRLLPPT